MSKNLRIELRFSALVHVGDDVTESNAPHREPDATEYIKLVRVAHLGEQARACDVAGEILASMTKGAVPILAERLRHELQRKGA